MLVTEQLEAIQNQVSLSQTAVESSTFECSLFKSTKLKYYSLVSCSPVSISWNSAEVQTTAEDVSTRVSNVADIQVL